MLSEPTQTPLYSISPTVIYRHAVDGMSDEASANTATVSVAPVALSKFAKYKEFRQLATLTYTSDLYNMYSIVSSIEFDKDSDFFAIAGVTKKIKVSDYLLTLKNALE